jgi:diguanylate cyclase (GGDEF)-like protein
MARDARRRAAKRRHHHPARRHRARHHAKKHPRIVHALMARDFSPALTSATAALGQSVTALAGASSQPGIPVSGGGLTRGSARLVNSSQVNALAGRVRAYSGSSGSVTHPAATTQTHPKSTGKSGHGAPAHASGGGFSLPFIPAPSQIEHLVTVVPESLWIAFGSALLLAAAGGTAALGYRRRARRHAGEYAAVAAAALTDPLTGVLNRRGFSEAVDRELARARRYGTPFALAYVDIRGLKAVNDTEGHLAGDEVIKQVAGLLGESVRTEDSVGRLGGDELALLLTGPSAHGREAVVDRVQARVPGRRAAMQIETPWDVTVGTASYPADGKTFDELVSTADRRLYEQRGIQIR